MRPIAKLICLSAAAAGAAVLGGLAALVIKDGFKQNDCIIFCDDFKEPLSEKNIPCPTEEVTCSER